MFSHRAGLHRRQTWWLALADSLAGCVALLCWVSSWRTTADMTVTIRRIGFFFHAEQRSLRERLPSQAPSRQHAKPAKSTINASAVFSTMMHDLTPQRLAETGRNLRLYCSFLAIITSALIRSCGARWILVRHAGGVCMFQQGVAFPPSSDCLPTSHVWTTSG